MSQAFTILDDLFSAGDQKNIDKVILRPEFPWFYTGEGATVDAVSYKKCLDPLVKEAPQHFHLFRDANGTKISTHAPLPDMVATKVLNALGVKEWKWLRAKANMQLQRPDFQSDQYNTPHVDCDDADGTLVILYYANDSDGDTRIFKQRHAEEEYKNEVIGVVSPIKGRVLVMDGAHRHAGAHPRLNSTRVVLNINVRLPSKFTSVKDLCANSH